MILISLKNIMNVGVLCLILKNLSLYFLGFCDSTLGKGRKKRDLDEERLYREEILMKRIKREDLLTEEDVLQRSYKTRLG